MTSHPFVRLHRIPGGLACAAIVALLGACAPAMQGSRISAADVPRLEAQLRSDEADVGAMVRLAAAYREAGRTSAARALLERARAADPNDPAATLYLGLALEDEGEYAQARELYERYLEVRSSERVAAQIRARLTVVHREELRESAREALAREVEISTRMPESGTVAVFPFAFAGGPPELQPLERAIAEMLVTDLAQSDRLTVLERLQVQMLLDEMELAAGGLTDAVTGARSARLLGAERVVQGAIRGDEQGIELDAAVVQVPGGQVRTVTERDALSRLFDVEKRLAFGIYEEMGIQLTPAERERVNRRPTENLQALLAFGLGLQALDAGDFQAAVSEFGRALTLDPNFTVAREHLTTAISSEEAAKVTTRDIAQEAAVEIAEPTVALEIESEAIIPSIVNRDPISEALGTEGIGQRTILDIIIRRP